MQWVALPEQAPPTPQRSSQIVHESKAFTPTGQHVVVNMERVSTGGTRYVQQFQRQQADGPMSAAERAQKKRVRAALFSLRRLPQHARRTGLESETQSYVWQMTQILMKTHNR